MQLTRGARRAGVKFKKVMLRNKQGAQTNSPTEYDFVGGIFDAALVEYRPKSPEIACFRACGAPWDAIRVGVARRGT